MRGCLAVGAHLVKHRATACASHLPRAFAAGEPAANDVNLSLQSFIMTPGIMTPGIMTPGIMTQGAVSGAKFSETAALNRDVSDDRKYRWSTRFCPRSATSTATCNGSVPPRRGRRLT